MIGRRLMKWRKMVRKLNRLKAQRRAERGEENKQGLDMQPPEGMTWGDIADSAMPETLRDAMRAELDAENKPRPIAWCGPQYRAARAEEQHDGVIRNRSYLRRGTCVVCYADNMCLRAWDDGLICPNCDRAEYD